MKVLVVSNGNGEDLIGATLIEEIIKALPDVEVDAFPLVGTGVFYEKRGFNVVLKNKDLPSGGFLTSYKSVLRDISKGILSLHFKQISKLLKFKDKYDVVFAVGDVFCMILAKIAAANNKLVFLPTAKSDYIDRHFRLEKKLIKKYAHIVFPRDNRTSDNFNFFGINSFFLGNVMMDNIEKTNVKFDIKDKHSVVIGILPGSRFEAYKNFEMIVDVLLYLYQNIRSSGHEVFFLVSVPDSLKESKLREILSVEGGMLNPHRFIFSNKFGDILHQSNFIIGMAGTANEQAVGLGKPVFTWAGRGPQTCDKRIEDQKNLLGKSLIVLEGPNSQKANILWKLVRKEDLYRKCLSNGLKRMGKKGAAKAIINKVFLDEPNQVFN